LKELLLINGPNMNMLGYRESSLYGLKTLAEIEASLEDMIRPKDLKLRAFQSNSEGKIISYLQEAYIKDFESKVETVALIVNLAAYTHTSLAIFDSLSLFKARNIPIYEVHLSNIFAREDFRKSSYVSPLAKAVITGLGSEGYFFAAKHVIDNL
jgi:3-dehydroquinate dehydratase-2